MSLSLTVKNLCVRTREGRVVLDVPSLQIGAGQLVGLQGPSGAGKTTFLHAVGGLLPFEGSIHWGDTSLADMSDRQRTAFRARSVGMIFQDYLLFDALSAEDNAAIAALFAPRKVRRALRDNAKTRLASLQVPMGARNVTHFSGGERQRVAVARALAGTPAILLADEPTAALDRHAADALIHDLLMLARAQHTTLLAVSHDPHLLEAMDRVLTLNGGTLVEEAIAP